MSERLTDKQRKEYLEMASRRTQPGSGTHADILRERTQRYGAPDLKRLLKGVPFVVIGGLATRLYMPERMTLDADVLVAPDSLAQAERALEEAGCTKLGPLPAGGSTWRLPDWTSIDVLALPEPWVQDAIAGAVKGTDELPYVALPFLVLLKLVSGRVQDLADITRMMGAADDDSLRQTRELVQRWRPQDAEDLESMIRLGRLEYEGGQT